MTLPPSAPFTVRVFFFVVVGIVCAAAAAARSDAMDGRRGTANGEGRGGGGAVDGVYRGL